MPLTRKASALLVLSILVGLFFARPSFAQDAASPTFVPFVGTGASISRGQAAGASQFGAAFGEAPPNLYRGILFEGGYTGRWSNFGKGSGIFSTNYVAQWSLDKPQKFLPFATVGYSRLFSTGNAVNFGGGLDFRLSNIRGIRFEVRDYYTFARPTAQHDVSFRLGYVIYLSD